ncbi:MAG: BatD family protein [Gammaproteobacteria bacterium]|nr:BatD family protein [Gammaproteobacteria bacterium]
MVQGDEVTATLDRNPVRLGESVRLVIELEGAGEIGDIDTTVLEPDFEVLGTASSSRLDIVDGEPRRTSRLMVELVPRREGRLVIPEFEPGGGRTAPIVLEVLAAASGSGGEVFVEVAAEPERAYVQSPVSLRVRLFVSGPLTEGNLSDPVVDGAQVRRAGEDTQYSAVRAGTRYRVIERRFLVTPGRHGRLTVGPVAFSGRIADPGQGAFRGLFGQGRRVRAHSESVELEILPPPQAAARPWLPARDVSITEHWPDGEPRFAVGQPVTRSIRIEADGVAGEQIPGPAAAGADGIRLYPDKPSFDSSIDDARVVGVREQRFAMVPLRPGALTLPEVTVSWWDTAADGGARGAPSGSHRHRAAGRRRKPAAIAAPLETAPAQKPAAPSPWRLIALAFALLWLATAVLVVAPGSSTDPRPGGRRSPSAAGFRPGGGAPRLPRGRSPGRARGPARLGRGPLARRSAAGTGRPGDAPRRRRRGRAAGRTRRRLLRAGARLVRRQCVLVVRRRPAGEAIRARAGILGRPAAAAVARVRTLSRPTRSS